MLRPSPQIGDPRMDSGATLPAEEQRPPFDPLTPLLPEEVCWILDRILACEVSSPRELFATVSTNNFL